MTPQNKHHKSVSRGYEADCRGEEEIAGGGGETGQGASGGDQEILRQGARVLLPGGGGAAQGLGPHHHAGKGPVHTILYWGGLINYRRFRTEHI